MKGLNQGGLAEKAGISRNAYRSIETGSSEPRTDNLERIAKALDVSVLDLVREVPELTSLRFRSRKSLTAQQRALQEDLVTRFALWLSDFKGLEEMLEIKSIQSPSGRPNASPEEQATHVRETLGVGEASPIIDITDLLEEAGIKLHLAPVRLDSFFGMSVSEADHGPAMSINTARTIPVERRIFSTAHELGHLIMHRDSYDGSDRVEDPNEEKEADQFAGYFLMPGPAFGQIWNEIRGLHFVDRVMKVKRYFQVSYRTVLVRLIEMGKLDNSIWRDFHGYYKRHVGRSLSHNKEPFPLAEPDFEEDKLDHLVRNALEKEIISLDRAAEILGLGLDDMRERVRSWEVAR
jgi:Zn-dependent peptidase ImmA (M78 family)/DNA-binding Xre family transcriptional regulator